MNLYNNIFGNKPPISAKEIEDYLSGKLSDKQMHNIELRAQSSNIDFDALEAYQQNPDALKNVSKLKTEMAKSVFKGSSYLKYFVITGIAASIGIFIFFYADIFNTTMDNKLAQSTTPKQETTDVTVLPTPKEQTGELFEEPQQQAQAEEKTIETTSTAIVSDNRQKEDIKPLEQKALVTINTKNGASDKAKLGFAYNTGIKYLARYKCVDYSLFERDNAEKKTDEDRGLEPEYANLEDKNYKKQSLNDDLNLSYFAYLEKAMFKYKKKKYSEAIAMYNTILKQYKGDLNAKFYKAMALYQLKKYEKAIVLYNQVIEDNINVFSQEAEYYKALSLLHTNKAEGEKLLQKIADNALFYSQKALIKLNQANE